MIDKQIWIKKSKLGGLRRIELYGNPGTAEGRSKGGKRTIGFFHRNPALARKVGFIIRKEIKYPERSVELAELIGIILGDGGLPGNHQLTIAFNKKTDQEYSLYLRSILRRLFSVDCYTHYRRNNNGANIIVSSSNLVDFLIKHGLVTGNKVKNQVDIPEWINRSIEYQKACLRGLVDTDGSFYRHKYKVNGKKYKYLKLCFTNCSRPLLQSTLRILENIKIKAYLKGDHVSVYSGSDVKKYFKEVGSHNPKHALKFKNIE